MSPWSLILPYPLKGSGYAGGSCGMVEGTQELHQLLLMLLRPGVEWCMQGTTPWVRCARATPRYRHRGRAGVVRLG